jgi:hypothetical protein
MDTMTIGVRTGRFYSLPSERGASTFQGRSGKVRLLYFGTNQTVPYIRFNNLGYIESAPEYRERDALR